MTKALQVVLEDSINWNSYRNRIINSNFDFWQRGITQTSSGYGSDDKWNNSHSGSTKTNSQQTFALGQIEVPGNPKYFSRTVVTSVVGSGNYVIKTQAIENVFTLNGERVTLTFWAKADSTRYVAIELIQDFGTGGSPSAQVTGIGSQKILLTTAWQKFSRVITLPSVLGKILGTNNDDCLRLYFWFDAGTSFDLRTAALGQQSGTFDIARVSLVRGDATKETDPTTPRFIGEELRLCQRYYEKSYDLLTTPGTITTVGSIEHRPTSVAMSYYVKFSIAKRAIPTITEYSTVTGSSGVVRDSTGGVDKTSNVLNIGQNGYQASSSVTSGNDHNWHYTASCDL